MTKEYTPTEDEARRWHVDQEPWDRFMTRVRREAQVGVLREAVAFVKNYRGGSSISYLLKGRADRIEKDL